MVVAVYPGTFDPLTRGHEDLVRRASSIFDTLVVGVADSRNKKPFFTLQERLDIAQEVLGSSKEAVLLAGDLTLAIIRLVRDPRRRLISPTTALTARSASAP